MSFFGLQLIMLMSPAQPKIRNYAPNPGREVWSLISPFPLPRSNPLFFFQTCLPLAALICSLLPLRAPHLPSFHALHSTIFPPFHSDFSRPSPFPAPLTSLHLLPLPAGLNGVKAANKLTSTLSTAPP